MLGSSGSGALVRQIKREGRGEGAVRFDFLIRNRIPDLGEKWIARAEEVVMVKVKVLVLE